MYRKRIRGSSAIEAAKRARDAVRMAEAAPDYPQPMPELRRRITIEDFDFGHVVHIIELHRSSRIDCYKAVVSGLVWKKSIGWSKVLEAVRKSFLRVGAK
jgi:hypothetical protein